MKRTKQWHRHIVKITEAGWLALGPWWCGKQKCQIVSGFVHEVGRICLIRANGLGVKGGDMLRVLGPEAGWDEAPWGGSGLAQCS